MSIQFFPLGIPLSSSFALSASFAVTTSAAGFPVSAALAEFSVNNPGPTGSAFIIVSASLL